MALFETQPFTIHGFTVFSLQEKMHCFLPKCQSTDCVLLNNPCSPDDFDISQISNNNKTCISRASQTFACLLSKSRKKHICVLPITTTCPSKIYVASVKFHIYKSTYTCILQQQMKKGVFMMLLEITLSGIFIKTKIPETNINVKTCLRPGVVVLGQWIFWNCTD